MIRRFVMMLGLICSLGCSGGDPTSPPNPKGPKEASDAVTKEIRGLVPEAASSPAKVFERLLQGGNAGTIESFSLTMFFIAYEPPKQREDVATRQAKQRELEILGEMPEPVKLAEAISKSREKEYVTLIQPEYITAFTCKVDGDDASGIVSFEAKGMYRGRVEYSARKTEKNWQIHEFRLPAHKVRLSRTEGGKWKKSALDPD